MNPVPGRAKRFVRSPKLSDWSCGPTSLLFNGYQGKFSSGFKWPRRIANILTLFSVEVKNAGSCIPMDFYFITALQDSHFHILLYSSCIVLHKVRRCILSYWRHREINYELAKVEINNIASAMEVSKQDLPSIVKNVNEETWNNICCWKLLNIVLFLSFYISIYV
jgi:hypothetical protein